MGSVSSRVLRAAVAFCVLSVSTACLGPSHATGRLGQFNNQIENKWAKQGAFMVMLPGYVLFSLGDNLIFNPIFWWTGSNPVDPPKAGSGPDEIGL